MLTHFSVCTGVGGIDRAAEEAGFTTVGQCEIDEYCMKVLELLFPYAERWRDIRDVTRESVSARGIRRIDLLSGGIPCQPHSVAGKRGGSSDERDLWPEFARLIYELGPRWVLVENVPGLLTSDSGRFFGRILRDLAQMGYDAGWCVYGADAVGANNKRERLFIMAHSQCPERWPGESSRNESNGENAGREKAPSGFGASGQNDGEELMAYPTGDGCGTRRAEPTRQQGEVCPTRRSPSCREDVANTKGKSERTGLCQDKQIEKWWGRSSNDSGKEYYSDRWPTQSRLGGMFGGPSHRLDRHRWPAGPGEPQYEWEPPRIAKGVKHRIKRMKALGNICIPQQVYPILQAISDIENGIV
ncbi:DNA cytosine methyltransferase [Desulforamulus ruminis]|uniref:DNA cytosine methyltransferase n=1 Tax=Desulforamulus ruminis TaxID=1564 RepID=UPI002357354C|nr:DNA cytosine methyltransferase [Desulforamulus ruminis]